MENITEVANTKDEENLKNFGMNGAMGYFTYVSADNESFPVIERFLTDIAENISDLMENVTEVLDYPRVINDTLFANTTAANTPLPTMETQAGSFNYIYFILGLFIFGMIFCFYIFRIKYKARKEVYNVAAAASAFRRRQLSSILEVDEEQVEEDEINIMDKDAKPSTSKDAKPSTSKDAKPSTSNDAKPSTSKDAKPSTSKDASYLLLPAHEFHRADENGNQKNTTEDCETQTYIDNELDFVEAITMEELEKLKEECEDFDY